MTNGGNQPNQRPEPSRLGGIRRSQVVGVFGPGSIVDTVPLNRPRKGFSGIVSGLRSWDENTNQDYQGLRHPQTVIEPRLMRMLNVRGFRSPPVISDDRADTFRPHDVLPMVVFPRMMVCPSCNRLKPFSEFSEPSNGHPTRVCQRRGCDGVSVAPARFVLACENGHIDDFPWKRWIGCQCQRPKLELKSEGAGLAGLVTRCLNKGCGRERSLEQAFNPGQLRASGITCLGKRPWSTMGDEQGCDQSPRMIQRGASSAYFPDVRSVISIPPFTDDISSRIGTNNTANVMYIMDQSDGDRQKFQEKMQTSLDHTAEENIPTSKDEFLRTVLRWWDAIRGSHDTPERWDEYLKMSDGLVNETEDHDFHIKPADVPIQLRSLLEGISEIPRLREVRAQIGFSRISPIQSLLLPEGIDPVVDIAEEVNRNWLPAVEINGEGLFIKLREEVLSEWEDSDLVRAHLSARNRRVQLREDETLDRITPRLIALHTLSHALMRRLTLSSGYSSSALKERIYSSTEDPHRMSGILISTGSPDSEGTLGGLVRQTRGDQFLTVFREMVSNLGWCSSDPVCIDGHISLSTPTNGAACHACVLAPETSCEYQNIGLDRALLVGTPEHPDLGLLNRIEW